MVVLGSEGVKTEDDVQGNVKPAPGRYHVSIDDVMFLQWDEENRKNHEVEEADGMADKIRIKFSVLAGTVPGQEGREIEDNFFLTDKAIARLQRLALCVGLLQPGEAQREVHFSQAAGRQLVIECEEHSYTPKNKSEPVKTVRIGFMGMWSLGNNAVSDVPKNQQAMQMAPQGGATQAPAAQQQAAAPAQQPAQATARQQPAQQPAAGDDKWGGL